MQTIKWLSFGLSNALTRTTIHFFPSAGSITAPYPASYKLTIFGAGEAGGKELEEKRVVLEGARLSQPDGVRVEDVFPALSTQNVGMYGLLIEVSTNEARVDVQPSQCIVELASKGGSARFMPRRLVAHKAVRCEGGKSDNTASRGPSYRAGLPNSVSTSQGVSVPLQGSVQTELREDKNAARTALIRDCFHQSSLVMVNVGAVQWGPQVRVLEGNGALYTGSSTLAAGSLKPRSVREVSAENELSDTSSAPLEISEQSWGLVRALRVEVEQPNLETGCFLLCREAVTRRPVSVVALGEENL